MSSNKFKRSETLNTCITLKLTLLRPQKTNFLKCCFLQHFGPNLDFFWKNKKNHQKFFPINIKHFGFIMTQKEAQKFAAIQQWVFQSSRCQETRSTRNFLKKQNKTCEVQKTKKKSKCYKGSCLAMEELILGSEGSWSDPSALS